MVESDWAEKERKDPTPYTPTPLALSFNSLKAPWSSVSIRLHSHDAKVRVFSPLTYNTISLFVI